MNIIVKTYGSSVCSCRPDTTWERENKDFYAPDCVDGLLWSPVIFARICKAGKCIGDRFASRYYDAFGFGALMYCRIGEDITPYADHTSLLPSPLYNPVVLENEGNRFEVFRDGEPIYTYGPGTAEIICKTICEASQLISLRIGDFVAVELSHPEDLVSRTGKTTVLKANYCGNELFNMNVIF